MVGFCELSDDPQGFIKAFLDRPDTVHLGIARLPDD